MWRNHTRTSDADEGEVLIGRSNGAGIMFSNTIRTGYQSVVQPSVTCTVGAAPGGYDCLAAFVEPGDRNFHVTTLPFSFNSGGYLFGAPALIDVSQNVRGISMWYAQGRWTMVSHINALPTIHLYKYNPSSSSWGVQQLSLDKAVQIPQADNTRIYSSPVLMSIE